MRGTVLVIAVVSWGVYVMYKKAPYREAINARFVKILEYCKDNPDFTWKHGEDAPVGFVEGSEFVPIV